jgi:hypothetical protein
MLFLPFPFLFAAQEPAAPSSQNDQQIRWEFDAGG